MDELNRMIIISFAWMLGAPSVASAGANPKTLIDKADQAIEQHPNDAKAYYNRGSAYHDPACSRDADLIK